MNSRPFGLKDKLGYAMGDLGCNLSFTLISTYMLMFYTQYIGITAKTWGVIILVLKIWDAINDPLMGGVIDSRKKTGTSRFKPWIKYGSFGLIVSASLFFLPITAASYWVKVLVCLFSYLMWDICYTIVNVPYGAMNSTITADPQQRASLSTWRTAGAAVGGAAVMVLPYIVFDDSNNLRGGMLVWVALAFGVIAFFAFFGLRKLTTERVEELDNRSEHFSIVEALKGFTKNRPLIAISLASFALLVFFNSTLTTNNLIFQSYFHDTKIITWATIISYVPMVLLMPFVSTIVKKFGKKLPIGMSLFVSIAACIALLIIPIPQNGTGVIIWMVGLMLINIGGGLFNLLCWAVVSDCIDYQELKTSQRSEGSTYAVYSLFRKLAQGVGSSLIAFALAAVGYDEKLGAAQTTEVATNIKTLSIVLVLIGAVIMCVSMLLIYNLGKKETDELRTALGRAEKEVDISDAILQNKE